MKTKRDPSTKPYYRCLSCPRFRVICGGRPTRDYDFQTWCELIRDVKEHYHLTNAYIAKEADVSIKTIERITAINLDQDIMRATARRIEQVVLGPVGEHTCYLDYSDDTAVERIDRLLQEIEYWKKENDRKAKIIDKYLDS
jgi:hypothetical protein